VGLIFLEKQRYWGLVMGRQMEKRQKEVGLSPVERKIIFEFKHWNCVSTSLCLSLTLSIAIYMTLSIVLFIALSIALSIVILLYSLISPCLLYPNFFFLYLCQYFVFVYLKLKNVYIAMVRCRIRYNIEKCWKPIYLCYSGPICVSGNFNKNYITSFANK
jgi:hypothetical protein